MDFEARGYERAVADLGAWLPVVADVARETGTAVQMVRGDRVSGRAHLARAVELSLRARLEGRATSPRPELEFLLYAAGERQIGKAIGKLGLRDGEAAPVVAVALGGRPALALDRLERATGWVRNDGVLGGDPAALAAFGVTAEERSLFPPDAWGALVLERVALTDLWKVR